MIEAEDPFEPRPSPATDTARTVPTVIGTRGPMRWPSSPAFDDSSSMRTVSGSVARPASSGV